jgi:hypothetical protein
MIAEKFLGMLYLFHNPADTGQYFARRREMPIVALRTL